MKSKKINKIGILVTGAGGCTVGEGIIKALRMSGEYDIYAADVDPFSPHLYLAKQGFILPRATDSTYVKTVISLCNRHNIDFVIPGSDFENRVLANYKYKINSPKILTNDPEVVKIGTDGYLTYKFLEQNNFPCPVTFLSDDKRKILNKQEFPLIIKPRLSQGSHNIFIAYDLKQLNFYLDILNKKGVEVIIQKYIGTADEEYTVGVTTSHTGKILSIIALKRTLIAGASFKMSLVNDSRIECLAEELSNKIESRGPLNFQARKENGEYYIFEINPRFSGTTPVRCGLGVNEPHILIRDTLKKSIPKICVENKYTVICRIFQEVYIDRGKKKKLGLIKKTLRGAKIIDYV